KDGMLVNHLDQREVINSVLKLLENEKLREKFRERGLKRAKKFSWEKTARETLKIYKQVLEGK
ncbi:MAG: glycosyltransferase family 1 protein, partial [Hadesarchaea archaeon]|nr:glycosyltransferase family 1 protein [Hadesarchaea archaeon]